MTNEAPTPDEVENALDEIEGILCAEAANRLDTIAVIRAHIAALEAKLAEQIREDEMRIINHCVKVLGNNSKAHIHAEAEFLTRIAELEAELANVKNESAIAYKSGRCDAQAELGHIEAENKLLVEELATYRRNDKSGVYSNRSKDED